VSGGGGDEPASDVMEVMDITVLEVIADNPPASNPEYIELPKSEKFDCKVCGKIQGCPCQFVFGFSVYFQFNYLLTMLLLVLEFLIIFGFMRYYLLGRGTPSVLLYFIFINLH
jgi:hypothetical protein